MGQVIKIEIPVEVTDKSEPALSNITNKLKKMDETARATSRGMENAGKVSGIERAYQKAKTWGTSRYQAAMEIKDRASPVISKLSGAMKGFAGKTWRTTIKAVDLATAPIRKVGSLLKSPLMAAGVTLSIGGAIGSAVNTYAGFESQMSTVKAISGATQDEFVQLTAKAKEMGATTKFTAQESAEAFTYMGMAGWKASDMMSGIGGILDLAAASGESLGTTSDIVTDALTAFGLKASDSGHFADVLATAASSSNTTVSGMGDTFKYVGSMAGALGYSIEDVSLAVGLMANSGIKGSMAGTALNAMFTRLSTNTSGATDAIRDLGVEFFNQDGSARDLSDVMGELRTATAGMSAEQKSALANTVAGMEAQRGLLAILNASEEDYNKLSTAIENADGASQKMADTMLDNLSGKFTLFKSALDGVKISLGERIQPYLMSALDWLTVKMPDVEDALMRGMNWVDQFVDNTKEKITEFTSGSEWSDAGLFGKMHIAWDELIEKPFLEWYSGGGSEMLTGKAAMIGQSIGTGLSGGLLALLGIDIGAGINEGASIGASFAQGFVSGFDTNAVQGAVSNALGGMFKNAGKIFTGDGDLTSWMSAAAIARVGVPILSLLGKGLSLGGGLARGVGRSASGGLLGKAIGSFSVGDELAGVGMVSGSGLMKLFGKTGMALGSGASTAGGLAAAGAGSIFGGIAGLGTLISAGKNIYKATKAESNDEQATNIASAGLKMTGVGAGAGLGAAIGSAFFGIGAVPGALIGAGIGGLAGMFGGNTVEESYQKRVEAAEKAAAAEELMAEKTKYALEGSRFESDKLKSAMEDTSVSAAQFGQMMQEAASQKIQDNFGNVKLSMKEIQDAAKQIMFGGDNKELTKYAAAAADAESSMKNLQSATSSMAKLNWKAGMGLINDEQSVGQYQTGIQDMISGAQQYVEDQHYQATAALSLLVEPGSPVDMTTGLNNMYADIQNQLSSSSDKLTAKLNVALEDGVITLDEQKELSGLQQQITDITSQISEAQSDAGMQSLKIKYSGAQLDGDSFANLTGELQSQVQESMSTYDEALEVSLTNLNMQLASGAISQEQFDTQFQALTEGYQAHVQELAVNVESFQLESIADAFESELDGILPDLQGTTAEKLGTAMHDAMAHGVDVENWDVETASKWLDLDGLSGETQSAITEMMSQVAATMPDALVDAMDQTGGDGDFLSKMLDGTDFTGFENTLMEKMNEGMSSVDMSDSGAGLQEGIQNTLNASLENVDLSEAATALNSKLGEAMSGIEMDESGSGLQEGIQNSISTAFEGMDLSGVAEGLSASLNEAISGAEGMDMSGFGEGLSESLNSAVSSMDFSGISSAVGTGVGSAIEASMSTIQGAISNLYSQVGSAINSAFAAGFQTTTTVTITIDYRLANPSATVTFSGGGTGTATVSGSIASNAEGSIVNGRLLSWVGEDGPEAIIPLGSKRRQRGLELWKQAGRMMGVAEYAEGGLIGISENEAESGETFDGTINKTVADNGNNKGITINVNLSPQFDIGGNDDNTIIQTIRAHLKEIADELGSEIAIQLAQSFENTPI